jgi:hypothetical protein
MWQGSEPFFVHFEPKFVIRYHMGSINDPRRDGSDGSFGTPMIQLLHFSELYRSLSNDVRHVPLAYSRLVKGQS